MWYESLTPETGPGDSRMKKRSKRHNPEQIVKKLRDADVMLSGGKSIEEVLKVLEVSEATFHRWRNQYGGMKSEEAKRLKDLEGENSRLKHLLAEAELDKAMLKEALRGND
jgi:putative transposase